MKFHDFSMTFHDQVSDFPWPFLLQTSHNFSQQIHFRTISTTNISLTIFWKQIRVKFAIFPRRWRPLSQLRSLQIFQAKFIAGQFWKILYLRLYFECELGQSFYFSMTYDIFVIFHDFSMTFHDQKFFHDFPWLFVIVGTLFFFPGGKLQSFFFFSKKACIAVKNRVDLFQ